MQVGKYQLVRKLATGGMAEVFLAKAAGPDGLREDAGRSSASSRTWRRTRAFVEMFLSEAKLAAQLNHPNIVQIFDFGEADGAYYLAMEYIDGPNLRALSQAARDEQGTPLPPPRCARRSSPARARGSPSRTTSATRPPASRWSSSTATSARTTSCCRGRAR